MNRRQFLQTSIAAAAALPRIAADQTSWGSPVLDIHLHPHRAGSGNVEMDHIQGSGVAKAIFLPSPSTEERAIMLAKEHPDRFARFTNADIKSPDAVQHLQAALKGGAIGIGELKHAVMVDGTEMKRVYDVANDFKVPVLIHFQEGAFNSGIRRMPALLKAYPNLIFVAHANSFWANISAEVDDKIDYPTGRIKPGGLSDHLLADFPNIYGDLSANSGRNALNRDPEFAAAFLVRHKSKLIFGSDCGCRDGHGLDQPQPPLGGKCTAQETLASLKRLASPELFRRITWENGSKLLKVSV
jgi:predicted TIM-barrel fold metal-dependent hydrolase